MCFYSAFVGFCFTASHIEDCLNTAADALSRNNINLFLYSLPTGAPKTSAGVGSGPVVAQPARLDLTALDQAVHQPTYKGIATSTASSYGFGVRKYLAFCTPFNIPPLPTSDDTLCCFVASPHLSPPQLVCT